jgi:hypothetical protein
MQHVVSMPSSALIGFWSFGPAVNAVPPDATAYAHREHRMNVLTGAATPVTADTLELYKSGVEWARNFLNK